MTFPVRTYINSPHGLVALGPEHALLPLPWGLDGEGPALTYGPYFDALLSFLSQRDYQPLRAALGGLLQQPIPLRKIQGVEVISQKHGAFYHVAQVRSNIAGVHYSFVVNSAVRPAQQAFLESEFALLQDLAERFPLGFVPHAFALGTAPCTTGDGIACSLKSFIAEWFEGYHEFHLSRQDSQGDLFIKVWDAHSGNSLLDAEEARSVYHQAALILTAYLDPESFSQIYPWHHAAGDFVLKRLGAGPQLRLITVRGYLPLVTVGPDPSEKWIPLVHFFLNLSLRMRLDRLDGTGELVWADPDCLAGVVSGFVEGWEQKTKKHPALPRTSEVMAVLRSFTPEEWLPLASLVLDHGLVETDESEFIEPRLEEHATSLHKILCEHG